MTAPAPSPQDAVTGWPAVMLAALRVGRLLAATGFLAGVLGFLGPGDTIHHHLHKGDIRPYFRECCCVNLDHSECAWGDHSGGPWMGHHPGISRFGLLLALASACAVGAATLLIKRARGLNERQRP